MGNGPSKPAQEAPAKDALVVDSSKTGAPAAPQCDVVISYHQEDSALVKFIKGKLDKAGISSFVDEADSSKKVEGKAGAAIVQTKVFLLVLSPASAKCKSCNAEVSLAYISDKPILPVSIKQKDDQELLKHMEFGLKLTLQNMNWIFFTEPDANDDSMKNLLAKVQENMNRTNVEVHEPSGGASGSPLDDQKPIVATQVSSETTTSSGRITMHHTSNVATDRTLIAKEEATIGDANGSGSGQIRTFWDRHFENEEQVVWFRFQQALLKEYGDRFELLFGSDQKKIQWILQLLHREVFSGKDELSHDVFMKFRGQRPEKDLFWKRISQIALESYTMHEVFNMDSTVRLAAVENLGKFSSPAVNEALLDLMDDQDANIRAVAAISLGRTGVNQERSVPRLIQALEDKDRLVREAACLSLGHLKSTEAVPYIINRWRNDFISHVREAAHVALKNIGGEEANKAIHMTEVLTNEIRALTK